MNPDESHSPQSEPRDSDPATSTASLKRLLFIVGGIPAIAVTIMLLVFWVAGGFEAGGVGADDYLQISFHDLVFRCLVVFALGGGLVYWSFSGRIRIVAASILIVCVLGSIASGRYFRQEVYFEGQTQKSYSTDETFYVPPHSVLRVASIGHPGFVADLLYIKALSYFVDHLFGDRRFKWLDAYVGSVIALDPKVHIYRWAAQAAKMGQLIDRRAVEKSNAYAQKGIEAYPDDWRLYLEIGFNYFFELPKYADSEEEQNRFIDQARDYFSISAMLPGSELDPNFVTSLFLENNDTQMALFHAYSRYMDASDREREELLLRIREIENADAIKEVVQRDKDWKESFPFMAQPFFQLIGGREERKIPKSWDVLVNVYDIHSRLEDKGSGPQEGAADER